MAKPPHTGSEMGVLYLMCWRRHYHWVGSGRVTLRHVSPIPPLDPCVRLSSHTAHERGNFTGNFHFTNSTDFTVVSLRIRWLPLYRCPHPPPKGLGHVRGFPAFRLLCPI